MFAWTSHSLLWRQSRQEPASVHAVHSRLFPEKPRARERGAPGHRDQGQTELCVSHTRRGPFHTMVILGLICRWLSRRNKVTTAICYVICIFPRLIDMAVSPQKIWSDMYN
jgi:hypothetical protein